MTKCSLAFGALALALFGVSPAAAQFSPGPGNGTVTSVALSTPGFLATSGSPVTTNGTLNVAISGATSGGVPCFNSATSWVTSAALSANQILIGGGAGACPTSTTTGTNILSLLANAASGLGSALVTNSGPTIANPTFTGTVAGAGTIPNSVLANSATTVNSQTCTLGGSCTITASVTDGSTAISGGVANTLLSANTSAQLSHIASVNSAVLATNGSGVPSLVTMLPNVNHGTPTAIALNNANAGTLPVSAVSASGTASSSTYLRGDGTWSTPPLTPVSSVRQTIQSGPIASSFPALFPATAASLSITTQNVSASVPIIASAAAGVNANGEVNSIGVSTSNLACSSLAANATNYLYFTASGGTLTCGSVTVQPNYTPGSAGTPQCGSAPVTVNQYTYDPLIGVMCLGNGSTASPVTVVFSGEAVTGASTVTSSITYAYNGYYYSGRFAISGSTTYSKSDNIGVPGPFVNVTTLGATTGGGVLYPFQNVYFSGNIGAYATKYDRNTSQLYAQPTLQVITGAGGTAAVEAVILSRRAF